MSRYSRSQHSNLSFAIVILVGAAAWTHRSQLVGIACIATSIMACLLLISVCWKIVSSRFHTQYRTVDKMNGLEFEEYVAELLECNGFYNVSLTEQYDYGVDIIAEKDGIRWGIQAKRYSGIVGADAVRQVVTGIRLYSCDRAMVVTNSTYGDFAKKLAAGNDCVLIDRDGLRRLEKSKINFNRGVIL